MEHLLLITGIMQVLLLVGVIFTLLEGEQETVMVNWLNYGGGEQQNIMSKMTNGRCCHLKQ